MKFQKEKKRKNVRYTGELNLFIHERRLREQVDDPY